MKRRTKPSRGVDSILDVHDSYVMMKEGLYGEIPHRAMKARRLVGVWRSAITLKQARAEQTFATVLVNKVGCLVVSADGTSAPQFAVAEMTDGIGFKELMPQNYPGRWTTRSL